MANRGFKLLQALLDDFSVHALGCTCVFCYLTLKVVALYDLGNHHLGCHNKEPQLDGLTNRNLFLTILEVLAFCLPAKPWHGTESSDVSPFSSQDTNLVMRDLSYDFI